MPNVPEKPLNKTGHWRDKFGGIVRKPRPWNTEVAAFLHDCGPTEVFLREDANTTEIVLRFPRSSEQLSEQIRSKYFGHEMSLSRAFNEVLWARPPVKGQHTCWGLLAKAGYDAYWAAWMHLLDVVYGEHFFAEANEQTKVWLAELKASRRAHSSGRRKELEIERESYRRRFAELVRWCEDLHNFVKQCNEEKLSKEAIEDKVFLKIGGQRHDHNIFSDRASEQAFCWTKNRIDPVLHAAQTWTPEELATALLARERECDYDTIARKIAPSQE
jgi:hypothetical protein